MAGDCRQFATYWRAGLSAGNIHLRGVCVMRLERVGTTPCPKLKFVADRGAASVAEAAGGDEAKKAVVTGRKIVVAVDSGPEAKAALQWALSHSLHGDDSLVLVSVVKPRRRRHRSQTERSSRSHQAFLAMQSMCQARRPEVNPPTCRACLSICSSVCAISTQLMTAAHRLACFRSSHQIILRTTTVQHAADEHIILTGQSGAISGGRARARAGDRRGGQEAGGFAASSRAGEAIHSVACGQTVEWQQHEKRRIGGLLHPERLLHDSGREEEEQERRRWLFDHHQTPQQLLALSMSKSMRPMLSCTLPY
ncbi:hypothetical protein BHE74_00012993 [Ensete ventricosum]|nr:hypothetical protein BHE74_00012993 [Ensete ventricosum]